MTLAALLPAVYVFPVAGALMVVIAGHILAMQRADIPRTRRRIRTANTFVMLVLTPLVAGLFGYLGPHTPRAFILVATACVALLGLMVLLALIDASNNARLAAIHRRELHKEIARLQTETAKALADAKRNRDEQAKAGANPDLRLTNSPADDA